MCVRVGVFFSLPGSAVTAVCVARGGVRQRLRQGRDRARLRGASSCLSCLPRLTEGKHGDVLLHTPNDV